MPDVFIPDVSEWQPNVNPAALIAGGFRAIIARLCYGTRVDGQVAAGRVRAFRAAGFTVIGWYIFLRASQPLDGQMALVKQILGQLGANEFLVVDWERDTDGSLPPVAMRDAALADLTAFGGKRCWLYGPASLLRQFPAPQGDPEWPASYETPDPALTGEVMWQYTDGQYTSGGYRPVNFPGIGLSDATVYHGGWVGLMGLVGVSGTIPAPTPAPGMIANCTAAAATADGKGYWLLDATGHVYCHGSAADHGSTPALTAPAVGIAADGHGAYWVASARGGLVSLGGAGMYQDNLPEMNLAKPVVGVAARPQGDGVWLAAADGGVFAFGAAREVGNVANVRLAAPVVGIAATPSGNGYWMVAADGGVFCFGDAPMKGGMSGKLAHPACGIVPTASGQGYWIVAVDGGVFNLGDAGFAGSMGGKPMAAPVVAAMRSSDGRGYGLVGGDGGVFAFGDFAFAGAGV